MMSVAEYASLAGISPRAVRLRAEVGTLLAQKVGRSRVVDDVERQRLRRGIKPFRGRPLTAGGFERLALFIDDDMSALTPEWRRRGKILALALRENSYWEETHEVVVRAKEFSTAVGTFADWRTAQAKGEDYDGVISVHLGINTGSARPLR